MITRYGTVFPRHLSPFRRCRHIRRQFASQRAAIKIPTAFPVIESCPAPTCECRSMPNGLEIDTKSPLGGTMATYSEQILISTGRNDWASKIEDDAGAALAQGLKSLLGRGGKYRESQPFYNTMISNSSFSNDGNSSTSSVYLLPSFKYIPRLPHDAQSISHFVKGFVLPSKLPPMHSTLSDAQKLASTRDVALQRHIPNVRDVDEILVLICGHGKRDARCGVLGPLLQAEFEHKLLLQGFSISGSNKQPVDESIRGLRARVGLISHIGGHKWAGNVIIYLPSRLAGNALAGKGIWYGRVTPEHVEGIVRSSIVEGRIIRDLFRGGVGMDRDIIRL